LKKETYPYGKVINYDLDNAGRTEKVYTSTVNYADMTSAADGAVRMVQRRGGVTDEDGFR